MPQTNWKTSQTSFISAWQGRAYALLSLPKLFDNQLDLSLAKLVCLSKLRRYYAEHFPCKYNLQIYLYFLFCHGQWSMGTNHTWFDSQKSSHISVSLQFKFAPCGWFDLNHMLCITVFIWIDLSSAVICPIQSKPHANYHINKPSSWGYMGFSLSNL